ncbi:MAG TPA: hypothetical protein VIM53_03415 [Candidatus Saccharimonadales bacterium]
MSVENAPQDLPREAPAKVVAGYDVLYNAENLDGLYVLAGFADGDEGITPQTLSDVEVSWAKIDRLRAAGAIYQLAACEMQNDNPHTYLPACNDAFERLQSIGSDSRTRIAQHLYAERALDAETNALCLTIRTQLSDIITPNGTQPRLTLCGKPTFAENVDELACTLLGVPVEHLQEVYDKLVTVDRLFEDSIEGPYSYTLRVFLCNLAQQFIALHTFDAPMPQLTNRFEPPRQQAA